MDEKFSKLDIHMFSNKEVKADNSAKKSRTSPIDRKKLLIFLIVIPVVIAVILVASVVPSFLKHKDQYEQAIILLYSQQYDDAREAFRSLGNYSDSREQVEKNVDYVHACDILNRADEDDMEVLDKAGAMFEALGDYKDSKEKIEKINNLKYEHSQKLLREEYDAALALLNNGKYVSASDAFKKLGDFSDSKSMMTECLYARAEKMYSKIEEMNESDQLRNVYVSPTPDDEDFVVTITEFPTENEKPICKVTAEEYRELGDYKDCQKKAQAADEYGDFTKEFYQLCAEGRLTDALTWLSKYNDDIPDRNGYIERLNKYLKYISTWGLKSGDPTLIPLASGVNGNTYDISTKVTVEEDGDFLIIDGNDMQFELKLKVTDDGRGFSFSEDDVTFYFVTINQVSNFAFMKYDAEGHLKGSSEYRCH